jgi:hypothetical protein
MYMQSAMRERRGLGCACGGVAELNVGLIARKCDPLMNYWRDHDIRNSCVKTHFTAREAFRNCQV